MSALERELSFTPQSTPRRTPNVGDMTLESISRATTARSNGRATNGPDLMPAQLRPSKENSNNHTKVCTKYYLLASLQITLWKNAVYLKKSYYFL